MEKIENKKVDRAVEQFQNQILSAAKDLSQRHKDIVVFLSLEDEYDNPDSVLKAADAQTSLQSYYSLLFHHANVKLEKTESAYKLWRSSKDIHIQDKLFQRNTKKGMTANNAKPTAKDVDNYFNEHSSKLEKNQNWEKKLRKVRERVSQLRIMRNTIESRQDTIKTISLLLGKCIDNGIISIKSKSKKHKHSTFVEEL